MLDAPLESRGAVSVGPQAETASRWRVRSRGATHLGLLGAGGAALGTLQLLHVRIAIHSDVGLAFVGLVLVHLAQRRRTLAAMATRLARARTLLDRRIRPVLSDALLALITLNILVSGIWDWSRGAPTPLPLPGPLSRWHLDSGIALVLYLVVHVGRRRRRLLRSRIR